MKKRLFPYGGIIRIRFNGSNLSLPAPLSKRRQKYKNLGNRQQGKGNSFEPYILYFCGLGNIDL